jgi:putative membrane protein insertion efficiency factor
MKAARKYVLAFVLFGSLLIFCDSLRSPQNQLSARTYIGIVHTYQSYGRPMLEGIIACRFRPTCSEYSIQAVEKYGIWTGLFLTFKRVISCTTDVPMGTIDEVP